MADRYKNYAELASTERMGTDYRIRIRDLSPSAIVIAPHGGWIEPGTSEIADAIAGSEFSFYAFEALKRGSHSRFHITSHRFDEPSALDLVARSSTAVAIHGRADSDCDQVWLGGRDADLKEAICDMLRVEGFQAGPNSKLPGVHKSNICNRTRAGRGVQLEIPRSLRRSLLAESELRASFCEATRSAIRQSSPAHN